MSGTGNPDQRTARERGCSCQWWGGGAITEFDPACPILDQHRNVPADVLGPPTIATEDGRTVPVRDAIDLDDPLDIRVEPGSTRPTE